MLLYEVEYLFNKDDIIEVWDGEKHIPFSTLDEEYKHTRQILSIRPSRLECAIIVEVQMMEIASWYPKVFMNDECSVVAYLNHKYGYLNNRRDRQKGKRMILYEIISSPGYNNTLPFIYRTDAMHFLKQRGMNKLMYNPITAKQGDYCRDGNKIFRVNFEGKYPNLDKVGLYYPNDPNYMK